MSEQESNTSYKVFTNCNKLISNSSEDKYTLSCCCITNKWYFQHTGLAAIKNYDNTANNYCVCLDCCTWCLEFRTRKYSVCEKPIICYLCCCSIYFID
jgi:hypothetical protein